ncbi:MAG: nucleoside triphosphate pyrophosphatase [Parvularculaceae bacterium]|nr:Maf-like protein [Parvularculaceae bacterium]
MTGLILASGSAIRARILTAAGIPFEIMRPGVDEDVLKREAAAAGQTIEETASLLADAKALDINAPGRVILGSDQILALGDRAFDKPQSSAEARERLKSLQGREHRLVNAVSIVQNRAVVFRHLETPRLFMRPMTDAEIDAYLDEAGDEILSSVGAYQVEALGSRLFDRIEGDYFAVLGLSLMPVLGYLRREGMLAY